jgi:hypothetical protein
MVNDNTLVTKMKQPRREYLQELADSLRTDYQYEFYIEFRGRGGWYGVANRWIGDTGEFLGYNWQSAEYSLKQILG